MNDDKERLLASLVMSMLLSSDFGIAKEYAKVRVKDDGTSEIDWTDATEQLQLAVKKTMDEAKKPTALDLNSKVFS